MKISLITTSFNSAATITDTLECIRRQTHPDIEHIIIDGSSTDNTLAIIANFPHVARLISEKDNGIYDAMNKGIRIATGEVKRTSSVKCASRASTSWAFQSLTHWSAKARASV